MSRLRRLAGLSIVALLFAPVAACGGGGGGGGISDEGVVVVTTSAVPPATTGEAYSFRFEADLPNPPGEFFVSGGNLPQGLTLGRDGVLSGYPRLAGSFQFAVVARDGADKSFPEGRDVSFSEGRRVFAMNVTLGPPRILPQQPPSPHYREGYWYTVLAAGGVPPYEFEIVGGDLPEGLALSRSGDIGYTALEARDEPYEFRVRVTDSKGLFHEATLEFTVIVPPLVVAAGALPGAALGFPYLIALPLASPGAGGPYAWTEETPGPGDTPLVDVGLRIISDGRLTTAWGLPGPTALGEWWFTARVADDLGRTATGRFRVRISEGPVLYSISPCHAAKSGPHVVTGLNFQPGATLIFKPGTIPEVAITPDFVDAQTLTFADPPTPPAGWGGSVPVCVRNPDGGLYTRPGAFVFPAPSLRFGTKGLVTTGLSSTGLDAADVRGIGRADVVQCGAAGFSSYVGGPSSAVGGLVYLVNEGGSPIAFTPIALDAASYYDVKFVDVDADGDLDIVALGATSVKVWRNAEGGGPLGEFTPGPGSAIPGGIRCPSEFAIARLDGNTVPDLVFGVAEYPNTNGQVHAMVGDGAGGFSLVSSAVSSIYATNGVQSLACVDVNQDGLSDVVAGVGWNQGWGYTFNLSITDPGGTFGAWMPGPASGMYYGNTTGVAAGDFLGDGTPCAIVVHTQDAGDGGGREVALISGSGLGSQVNLPAPSSLGKCVTALDGDFDTKTDAAVSTHEGQVVVYRGATQTIVQTLDATAGVPAVSAARTGRLASADLDGDGRSDLLVATSYWATDYQPNVYGTYYSLNLVGDGSVRGFVFWLNSSD